MGVLCMYLNGFDSHAVEPFKIQSVFFSSINKGCSNNNIIVVLAYMINITDNGMKNRHAANLHAWLDGSGH